MAKKKESESWNRQQTADYYGVGLSAVDGWLKARALACLKVRGRVIITKFHRQEFERAHTQKAI